MTPRRSSRVGSRSILSFLRRTRKRRTDRQVDHAAVTESLEERLLLSATIGRRDLQYKTFPEAYHLNNQGQFLTGPTAGDPLDIAMDYLRSNAGSLNLTQADLDATTVDNLYTDAHNGVTHVYLSQNTHGLEIYSADINVNIAADGSVINVGSSFVRDAAGAPNPNPGIDVLQGLTDLVDEFGWEFDGQPTILDEQGGIGQNTLISASGISMEDIPAELKYVWDGTDLELVWHYNIQTLDSQSWYEASVSATDGDVLHLVDWVAHAQYNVFPLPGENPADIAQELLTDPHDPIPSPQGWHDTDGVAGAEFTDTRGNNVSAQEDKNGDNAGGTRPDGGQNLIFDFTFDPSVGAVANENVAIVNLFYWNNIIHDVTYHYGFNEISGNFQTNNFGNGGAEMDAVQADALDNQQNGARNNANFATPPDGMPGRMQMYEFDITNPTRDSDLSATIIIHEFGHGVTNRLTGGPGNSSALQAIQSRSMGEGWSDWLALMTLQKDTDQQNDTYPVGNYVLGNPLTDPNGGIRRFPYTFDITINPLTYGDIGPFSVHDNGEIMASTLWDLNWYFINGDGANIPAQGYDPDVYTGTGGNNLNIQLVMDAFKLQPANPTYLDFRDAMLAADQALTGGANELAIWTAFARRGMGFSAFDGGTANSTNVREAFDLPPGLLFTVAFDDDTISEDDGQRATRATVRRSSRSDVTQPLLVTLVNSDPTEISIPDTVTIPAGRTFVRFDVNAVDDTELDGTQTVSVTASAPGQNSWIDTIDVLDAESLTLSIAADEINEDAGPMATTATLTRSNTDTAPPSYFVTLGNEIVELDRSGAVLQTITIPYGSGLRPPGEDARDLIVTPTDRVAVYNGTDSPFYSSYNQNSMNWTHRSFFDLSTDSAIPGSGGIAALGRYIFMTDMNTPGNAQRGLVRFDTFGGPTRRFGTTVPGDRLFATGDGVIRELDPLTGLTINQFAAPATQGVNDGLAFDGQRLWYLSSEVGPGLDDLYQLDPDTGNVQQQFDIGITTGFDGLAVLGGLVFLQDRVSENDIVVFDPVAAQVVNILDIDGINPGVTLGGGLAGATGPDVLYATDAFSQDIYEIDPVSGAVLNSFAQDIGPGDLGLAVLNDEVYVGTSLTNTVRVYSRDQGVFIREITLPGATQIHSLGGDDVQGAVLSPYDFVDVTAGFDNMLYALDQGGTVVSVYDPNTMILDRLVGLSVPVSAITVDTFGNIFGVASTGTLYAFDPVGVVTGMVDTGVPNLIDIDLSLGGDLVIGSESGVVVQSDINLSAPTTIVAGATPVFVAFSAAPGSATGDLDVTLVNGDPTEIDVPAVVTIPAGQQSTTFFLDAVDDFLFDGTQTAVVTPFAPGYSRIVDDSVDVLDVENIFVDIDEDQVVENEGAGAATITVARSNIDGPYDFLSPFQQFVNDTDQTILDLDTIISTIEVPPQLARVEDMNIGITLTHGFVGDLDVFLVSPGGTRIELFTDIGNNGTEITELVLDDEAFDSINSAAAPFTGSFMPEQPLGLLDGEDVAGTWTLEVTDDTGTDSGMLLNWYLELSMLGFAPLDVTLTSSDTSEAVSSTRTVTIPVNQLSATVPLDAVDDNVLDGDQLDVTITGSAAPYLDGSDVVDVLDYETLVITIDPGTIAENDGPGAATGTVTRSNVDDLGSALVVTLENRDRSEITIPDTVTIQPGQQSATFAVDARDDAILDGTQRVRVNATNAGYIDTPDSRAFVEVEDHEPILVVTLDIPDVFENDGFATGTVARTNTDDLSLPLVVSLTSSDPGSATVPGSLVIPAGRADTTFTVTLIDNDVLEGDRAVTITANAPNTFGDDDVLTIRDFETLSVSFDPDSFAENAGAGASVGTVTRNNSNIGTLLVVTLTSNDPSELSVPATVTIPANAMSATFDIAAVNDDDFDGPQVAGVTVSATGYQDATGDLLVTEHEPPVLTGPEFINDDERPVISWEPVPGASGYQVRIDNLTTGEFAIINDRDVTDPFYIPEIALGISKYRVRVRAFDQLENPAAWSRFMVFHVKTSPNFTSPEKIPPTTQPEFAWTAVVDAQRYELKVNSVTTGRAGVINEKNLTTTTFTPDFLAPGTYKATVRAIGANNLRGRTDTFTFTNIVTPTLLSPNAGATFDRLPLIEWTESDGADRYDLRIHNLSLGAEGRNFIRDRFVTETSFIPSADLPDGTYRISVRGITPDGGEGGWSEGRTIRVAGAPVITTPKEGETVGQFPTFRFTAVEGAERYDLRVRRDGNTANIIRQRSLTSTAYTHDKALPRGDYRVWVRAISPLGEKTRWSAFVDFSVAQTDPLQRGSAGDGAPELIAEAATPVMLASAPADPIVTGTYIEPVAHIPTAAVAERTLPTFVISSPAVIDAVDRIDDVMAGLPRLDPDAWDLEADTEVSLEEELDSFVEDSTDGGLFATGAALAAALPLTGLRKFRRRNRRRDER